ncbi:LpxI family protein [Ochrobactrum sp. CGA5]|uniref:LpxI family protein n=1 Tax=Ochrobactrum sp. CGA5 TaxID=2583453 RepID=UPI0011219F87|nr:LpxI family protein [Ochrobactrum sp. CGA5]
MTATKIEEQMRLANDAGRIAIIAGNGLLPINVAAALEAAGKNPFLVPLRGEADPALYKFEHQEISIVEFAKLVRSMKAAGVERIVLAGGVTSRPQVSDLKFDWPTLRAVPYVLRALGKGDDALLRAFIGLLESLGFKVVGAHEVVPDLLSPSPAQVLTRTAPDTRERRNIELAMEAALRLGDLDVGQGAVAVGGRVVALEGAEGTDQMIERVGALRAAGRIPRHGGVLVKMAKPQQDERADLPTIGVSTVDTASKAGLSGIAVEAGRTFILGFGEAVARANERGLFIETVSRARKDIKK